MTLPDTTPYGGDGEQDRQNPQEEEVPENVDVKVAGSEEEGGETQAPRIPGCQCKLLCALILVTRIAEHYDAGALAALYGDEEERMAQDMDMSSTEQGLLISMGYVGLVLGCLVAGWLLQRVSAKVLLQVSLVLLGLGITAFAASPSKELLQVARLVVGLGQAIMTVLYPVWVDEYAPPHSASGYMAALQAGGPLGTVMGYLVAGFLMANSDLSWRYAFVIQGCFLAPCFLLFFFVPAEYMDLRPREGEAAGSQRAGLKLIVKDGLVWFATLTLSSLYFVVNGLQTWVTDYIVSNETAVDAAQNTVVASFGLTAATAPVLGIIVGGVILVKTGGYRGHINRVGYVGMVQGILACIFAFSALAVKSFVAFIILIWLLLFFGGGMVPGLMGIIVAGVGKEYRGLVSAFAAIVYNLLGYALGPLAAGVVADQFDGDEGIVWGFRLVLAWSGVALLLQSGVACVAQHRVKEIIDQHEAAASPTVEKGDPAAYPASPHSPDDALAASLAVIPADLHDTLNRKGSFAAHPDHHQVLLGEPLGDLSSAIVPEGA